MKNSKNNNDNKKKNNMSTNCGCGSHKTMNDSTKKVTKDHTSTSHNKMGSSSSHTSNTSKNKKNNNGCKM